MQIRHALLCDAANASSNGNLNALGIFNTIVARRFPATHPAMTVVVQLELHRWETGPHSLRVELVDADGRPVLTPMEADSNTGPENLITNYIFQLNNLTFPSPGDYAFEILVDGGHLYSIPLKLLAQK
ncbi:MAG: hypothetical protein AB1331_09490 [Bacillota bacterium]